MKQIAYYTAVFKKLKRAHQYGGAPHKPILLLSLLEGVARGEITSNKIFITPELILCFKELWSKLVHSPHQLNFALPFFHMQSESFWKLKCKEGQAFALTSSNSIKSLTALNDALAYAEIDEVLFIMMCDPIANGVLRKTLLQRYFPSANEVTTDYSLLRTIENQILHEDQKQYKSNIEALHEKLSQEEIEEDLFVRGSIFKREVPKMYNYTCAISGMRIVSVSNTQMVDACHIKPFAESKDDTLGNGISLSPNFHRAFDRGLITISNDYKVIVSEHLVENQTPYSLSQFNGQPILLPENKSNYPYIDNLEWHRINRFLK
jgi:putative restriction endonuclease